MNRLKYILILLLFFSLHVQNGFSQPNTLSDPQPSFIALIVSDIDTSLSWYSSKLGFELLNKIENEERGFKQANIKRADFHIELIELNTALHPSEILKDKPPRTRIGGIFKFGFTVSKFDDWITHLTNNDVKLNGQVVTDPISNRRMIIINDPDGNRIQIFEND